ncbi:MAG: tetratricopeptide repeat protein [Bacteroidetes bacterium]|nr:tetratricopeptide repeat protein [Bacteroidota bacterium]
MKKLFIPFFIACTAFTAAAQTAAELHETARTFMRQGDYTNAIVVLNRAVQQDPKDIEIAKDLALNYYLAKDFAKALETSKPLLDRTDADDQCYQITGDILLAQDNPKECEKLYRKGIKQFPNSGPLYNALGELLWAQKDYSAIKQWEKGIQSDPAYSKNYYNASKYYYFSMDKTWSLVYGEIFLNMEPNSTAAAEMKNILLEGYKKLFADANLENEKNNPEKNLFVTAFLKTMNKQSKLVSTGITPETLTMVRTRFILDWYNDYGTQFPLKIFDLEKQLLQEGMFNAYNQWIFGVAQNLPAYQNWITTNAAEYNELARFQKNRLFKMPVGQYYH